MRVGILLILLQSVLFCAEGRTEAQTVELESAHNLVGALIQGDGGLQDQPDTAATGAALFPSLAGAMPASISFSEQIFSSAILAAHPIRGPPARQ